MIVLRSLVFWTTLLTLSSFTISGQTTKCLADYQCGNNAYCDVLLSQTCLCHFGFAKLGSSCVPDDPDPKPTTPVPQACVLTTDPCPQNMQCDTVLHQCLCKLAYIQDSTTGKDCLYNRIPVNWTCSSDAKDQAKCGLNAYCDSYNCKCRESYILSSNQIDCKPYRNPLGTACKTAKDCGLQTVCNSNHRCQCLVGYVGAENQIDCHVPKHKVNQDCSDSDQCGKNAKCVGLKCHCQPGYSTDSNQTDCFWNGCYWKADCPLFANCIDSQCQCYSGYEMKGKKCIEQGAISGWAIALIVIGVIAIITGLAIGALFWRRKRMTRLPATTRTQPPTTLTVQFSSTPLPSAPPPPTIDQ